MTIRRVLLALLLVVGFGVFYPGLSGGFQFDDSINITANPLFDRSSWSLLNVYEASVSGNAGPFKRPISMASFALNAATSGLHDPYYFKITNLLIHLLNGLIVFWVSGLVFAKLGSINGRPASDSSARWCQFILTAIWLLHPLNLTSVLYVVQRMNSLAALFSFVSVGLYMLGRDRLGESRAAGWGLMLGAAVGAGGLAALSKENGVLVPLLLLIVESLLYRWRFMRRADRNWLICFFVVTVVLPFLALLGAALVQSPLLFSGYSFRDFSMGERLLTQSRVICFYLQLFFAPSLHALGLYHDDFVVSRGVMEPATTLPAMIFITVLASSALIAIRRFPVFSFGVLWFLAGHTLESTVLPLEMVHEHRNYLPAFGLAFIVAYCLGNAELFPDTSKLRRFLAVAAVVLCGLVTAMRAEQWGDPVLHAIKEAENHPESQRANEQLGQVYFALYLAEKDARYVSLARSAYKRAQALSTTGNSAYFALLQLDESSKSGLDRSLFNELLERLKTRTVLPSTTASISALLDCQYYAYCRIPDPDIEELLHAIINNPKARGGTPVAARMMLAQYLVDKMGNTGAALAVLQKGLEASPDNLTLLLGCARVLRLMGRKQEAIATLTKAESIDMWRERRSETAEIRELLQRPADAAHK